MPKSVTHKGIIFTQEIYNYLASAQIDLVYHKPSKQIRIYIGYGDSCHDQYLRIKQVIDQANRQLHEGRIQDNYRNSHHESDTLERLRGEIDLTSQQSYIVNDTIQAGDPIPYPPSIRSSNQNAGVNDDDQDDYDDEQEDPDHAER